MTARFKGPTEGEIRSMIGEAKRAIKDLNGDLRTALLDRGATNGIRDKITDAKSRIRGWEAMLEEIAEQAAKVTAGRVAELRFSIAVAAAARVTDVIAGLAPPAFPTPNAQRAL